MKNYIGLLFMSILTASLFASDVNSVEFPSVDGWKLKASKETYSPENLWDLINGGAGTYINYGFADLHLADYTRKGVTVHVQAYHHNSLTNAFGMFSAEKSPDFDFIDIGAQGYVLDDMLNFHTGEYYIKMYTNDVSKTIKEDLKLIASQVAGALNSDNKLPLMFDVFPAQGKKANSEMYVIKQFLYQDFLENVYSVEYEEGYTLFVLEGTDNSDILETAKAYLNYTKQVDTNPKDGSSFTIEDTDNGKIPVIISGKYFVGSVGGADNSEAKNAMLTIQKMLN